MPSLQWSTAFPVAFGSVSTLSVLTSVYVCVRVCVRLVCLWRLSWIALTPMATWLRSRHRPAPSTGTACCLVLSCDLLLMCICCLGLMSVCPSQRLEVAAHVGAVALAAVPRLVSVCVTNTAWSACALAVDGGAAAAGCNERRTRHLFRLRVRCCVVCVVVLCVLIGSVGGFVLCGTIRVSVVC